MRCAILAMALLAAVVCVTAQTQETVTKTKLIQWRANQSRQTWSEEGTVRLRHSFKVPEDGRCRLFAVDASFVDYHPGGDPMDSFIASPRRVELTKYGSEIVHNIPDWWWGQFSDRSPRLSRNPSEQPFAFDNEVAFDGEWSLRLDPIEAQPIVQYLFVGVTPETRYRLSARVRRLEHNPKTGIALVQYWTDENGERQGKSDKLGYVTDGPLGEWVEFEAYATTVPGNRYCSLYFYGHGTHQSG